MMASYWYTDVKLSFIKKHVIICMSNGHLLQMVVDTKLSNTFDHEVFGLHSNRSAGSHSVFIVVVCEADLFLFE